MSYKLEITLKNFSSDNFLKLNEQLNQLIQFKPYTQTRISVFQPPISKKKLFTVLKSPHVYKKSREQFQFQIFQRRIYISNKNLILLLYIDILLKQYICPTHQIHSKLLKF